MRTSERARVRAFIHGTLGFSLAMTEVRNRTQYVRVAGMILGIGTGRKEAHALRYFVVPQRLEAHPQFLGHRVNVPVQADPLLLQILYSQSLAEYTG